MLSQSSRSAFPHVIQLSARSGQKLGQSQLLSAIQNVALVLGDDERETSNFRREVAQLDATKVRQRNVGATIRFTPPLVDLRFDGPLSL